MQSLRLVFCFLLAVGGVTGQTPWRCDAKCKCENADTITPYGKRCSLNSSSGLLGSFCIQNPFNPTHEFGSASAWKIDPNNPKDILGEGKWRCVGATTICTAAKCISSCAGKKVGATCGQSSGGTCQKSKKNPQQLTCVPNGPCAGKSAGAPCTQANPTTGTTCQPLGPGKKLVCTTAGCVGKAVGAACGSSGGKCTRVGSGLTCLTGPCAGQVRNGPCTTAAGKKGTCQVSNLKMTCVATPSPCAGKPWGTRCGFKGSRMCQYNSKGQMKCLVSPCAGKRPGMTCGRGRICQHGPYKALRCLPPPCAGKKSGAKCQVGGKPGVCLRPGGGGPSGGSTNIQISGCTASSTHPGNYKCENAYNNQGSEWASLSEKTGAWIQLSIGAPATIKTIIIADRVNPTDNIKTVDVSADGGATATTLTLKNVGTQQTFTLSKPISVKSTIRFTVTSIYGSALNIGVNELAFVGYYSNPNLPGWYLTQGLCRDNNLHGGWCNCPYGSKGPGACLSQGISSGWKDLLSVEYRLSTKQCALVGASSAAPSNCPAGCTPQAGTGNSPSPVGDGNTDNICLVKKAGLTTPTGWTIQQGLCRDGTKHGGWCNCFGTKGAAGPQECFFAAVRSGWAQLDTVEYRLSTKQCAWIQVPQAPPTTCPTGCKAMPGNGNGQAPNQKGTGGLDNLCLVKSNGNGSGQVKFTGCRASSVHPGNYGCRNAYNGAGSEWASKGEKTGAWLEVNIDAPATITRMVIADRVNPTDNIKGLAISADGGPTVTSVTLGNTGKAQTYTLSKPINAQKRLRVTVTSVYGNPLNIGINELQFWGFYYTGPIVPTGWKLQQGICRDNGKHAGWCNCYGKSGASGPAECFAAASVYPWRVLTSVEYRLSIKQCAFLGIAGNAPGFCPKGCTPMGGTGNAPNPQGDGRVDNLCLVKSTAAQIPSGLPSGWSLGQGLCRDNSQHGGWCNCYGNTGARGPASCFAAGVATSWPNLVSIEYRTTNRQCAFIGAAGAAPTNCPKGCVGMPGTGSAPNPKGDGTLNNLCLIKAPTKALACVTGGCQGKSVGTSCGPPVNGKCTLIGRNMVCIAGPCAGMKQGQSCTSGSGGTGTCFASGLTLKCNTVQRVLLVQSTMKNSPQAFLPKSVAKKWTPRNLNTVVVNTGALMGLSNGIFSLKKGTYMVEHSQTYFTHVRVPQSFRGRLWSITRNVEVCSSMPSRDHWQWARSATTSTLTVPCPITVAKDGEQFQLRYYAESAMHLGLEKNSFRNTPVWWAYVYIKGMDATKTIGAVVDEKRGGGVQSRDGRMQGPNKWVTHALSKPLYGGGQGWSFSKSDSTITIQQTGVYEIYGAASYFADRSVPVQIVTRLTNLRTNKVLGLGMTQGGMVTGGNSRVGQSSLVPWIGTLQAGDKIAIRYCTAGLGNTAGNTPIRLGSEEWIQADGPARWAYLQLRAVDSTYKAAVIWDQRATGAVVPSTGSGVKWVTLPWNQQKVTGGLTFSLSNNQFVLTEPGMYEVRAMRTYYSSQNAQIQLKMRLIDINSKKVIGYSLASRIHAIQSQVNGWGELPPLIVNVNAGTPRTFQLQYNTANAYAQGLGNDAKMKGCNMGASVFGFVHIAKIA